MTTALDVLRTAEHQRDFGLAELIHPVDPRDFARDYRDRRELLVRRGDPSYFEHLLRLSDLDAILVTMGAHPSLIRLVHNGRVTPAAEPRAMALQTLLDQYRDGATINLMYLHERWPPLARLCSSLTVDLTAVVHTNVYLTPRREQGLRPHYDIHDVFVTQIHGTKHWRLYESSAYRLPVPGQQGERIEGARLLTEFDLEPGDTLYLPRGTVHDATSNDQASLHLTIGVTPVTWASLVYRALDAAIARDRGLREALPSEVTGPDGWQEAVQKRVAEALTNAAAAADTASLVAAARRKLLAGGPPELSGRLLDLEALASVDLETPMRRRQGLTCSLSVEDGTASLEFAGKLVQFPERVFDDLSFIAGSDEVTGSQLPGHLDDAGRLLLLRTLLREGLLTTRCGSALAQD